MVRLLLATRNPYKTREFANLLGEEFALRDLNAHTNLPAIIESGGSFEENATLKARTASKHVTGLVIADDSGLEVAALDGAPGIFSARYAGENASDVENMEKLLSELSKISPPCSRRATFRCVLAIARKGKVLGTVRGVVEGNIADQARGEYGFGYDPVFVPDGFDRTFAELPAELKNRLSHRAHAVRALRKMLRAIQAEFA